MNKLLYIFFILIILSNCSLKPVVKHHGVPFLEKKQASLIVNKSNKNDIKVILGSPSTISKFDNDIWIFIERKQTQSKIKKFGQMEIFVNNVLVLELDNYGILKKKDFYNKDDMEKIEIVESHTQNKYRKDTFIYNFLSSVRQRVNDPLGKRVKKRKEISQR